MNQIIKYYYYLDADQKPVITDQMPENFRQLDYAYVALSPNEYVAKMSYQTYLRISGWRGERDQA